MISASFNGLREEKEDMCAGFVHILSCYCVQGSNTQDMLDMGDAFDEKKGSEYDRTSVFRETQVYIVLKFVKKKTIETKSPKKHKKLFRRNSDVLHLRVKLFSGPSRISSK